jgi:hypothetical protein
MSLLVGGTAEIDTVTLSHEEEDEVTVEVGNDNSDPVILAQWLRDWNGKTPEQIPAGGLFCLFASMVRDNGVDTIELVVQDSDDGIAWNDRFINVSSTDAAYTAKVDAGGPAFDFSNRPHIRLIARNGDGATDGRIKDIKLIIQQIMPIGVTVSKI